MKIGKFFGISMLMLVLSIGFASCNKDEYESRIHELLIDSKKLVFEADEESGELTSTLTFRNEDLSNYMANTDVNWCFVMIDPEASTITITVNENDTFEERKANVTLLDLKDGVSSRTFVVTQHQNDVVRVVDGEGPIYEVDTDGGQVVIHLESNVSYQVNIPSNVDWITLSAGNGTRGLQQSQVVLDVAKNTSEQARSAQIDIRDETSGAMTVVRITQSFRAYLKVLEKNFTVDELGGDISVYVQTNISFDFYTVPEDSWVKKKGNRERIDDNTVCQIVNIAPFNEKSPKRTSSLSVENASFGEQVTVKITQTRNLYIQESSIKLLTGASQKLSLYNANSEAVYWKSEDENVATVDDEGTVIGVGAGTTSIWVYSSDGSHSDNVSVIVEKPTDLKEQISYQWQQGYTPVDDVSVLTSLTCTITNNSEYDLLGIKATLYCDDVVTTKWEFNDVTGPWAVGQELTVKIEIPVEYEEDSVVRDTIENEDGTMMIHETTIPGKPKENTHQYLLVWEYKHSSEIFTYSCYYPEKAATARKQYARRNRKR
jgi:hypothetical protein